MILCTPRTEAEFEKYYELRWKVLRKPWKQPRGSEKDDSEQASDHLMVCDDDGNVVGVGRLHLNSDTEAQIRFMAVDKAHRCKGIGKLIVTELERRAERRGARVVVLNAREQSMGFYRKMGYESLGAGHVLFGTVKHVRMCKRLS